MLSVVALLISFILETNLKLNYASHSTEEVVTNKSMQMIQELMEDIADWEFESGFCEQNALNGIRRISQIQTSHPIKEGISLIYFIKKSHKYQDPLFGSTKVDWFYHCCLGFKDLYVDKDWFIDLSYHLMVGNTNKQKPTRMIEREQYIPNIPDTVNAYVIPLKNLVFFSNVFRLKSEMEPFEDLDDFLKASNRTCYAWVFSPDVKSVRLMINQSLIYKFENMTQLKLPTKHSNEIRLSDTFTHFAS